MHVTRLVIKGQDTADACKIIEAIVNDSVNNVRITYQHSNQHDRSNSICIGRSTAKLLKGKEIKQFDHSVSNV